MVQAKVSPEDDKQTGDSPQDLDKLESGPVEDRSCTDILCCLIFVASIGGFIYLFTYALTQGEPTKLLATIDQNNNICGHGDYSSFKYLYFPSPGPDYITSVNVCVKECPTSDTSTITCPTGYNCATNCTYSSNFPTLYLGAHTAGTNLTNTFCIYKSEVFLDTVCYPQVNLTVNSTSSFSDSFSAASDINAIQEWFEDIVQAKYVFLIAAGACFVLGIIYMIFTRIFAGLMVWLFIIAYFVGIIALAVFVYLKSVDEQEVLDENDGVDAYTASDGTTYSKTNVQTFQYVSYVIFGIAGLSFIGLLCMWKNIKLAIAIIKTATLFVIETPLVMLVPPMFAIVIVGWWALWIIGFVYLYSVGTYSRYGTTVFVEVSHDEQTFYSIWVYIFFGLWINAFFLAVNTFVLASTTCIWYFSQGSGSVHRPISRSLYRAFRYHLGSLAFGSFILAVVQLIRLILEYINHQAKKSGADKNKLVKCILCYLRCCMACFQRFIEFLNKNAYIQVALSGRNFCSGAKEAVRIIWANPARFTLVGGLGNAFIGIGKIFMVIATVWLSYYLMVNVDPFKSDITSPFLPCILIFFISYAIASIYMMVYGMAIDSILMCFLYDEEMNKGKGGAPKHCPDLLKEFIESSEKK